MAASFSSRRRLALACLLTLAGCHDLDRISVVPACEPNFVRVGDKCLPEPPTCAGDAPTCGPGKNDSCCSFDLVDTSKDANGGRFDRSYDTSGQPEQSGLQVIGFQAKGAATAIISPYYLDRYEVTVGRFRKLYNIYDEWLRNNPLAGAGAHTKSAKVGWRSSWRQPETFSTSKEQLRAALAGPPGQDIDKGCEPQVLAALEDPTGANDHKPMTCINWYEAYLFCIYDGARLPTEAEWNYAAAGGSQQRAYPWSPLDGDGIVIGDEYANVAAPAGAFRLLDVGSLPKGMARFGHHDLAGNAIEWVFDRCSTCAEYRSPNATDPVDIDVPGDVNVIARGGSFRFGWGNARTAFRQRVQADANGRFQDTGWRCARNGP